jgi:hypothetical protein
MTETLKHTELSTEEWEKLSQEYAEEIRSATKYYHFFANIQKQLETTLKKKFAKIGIRLKRDVKEEDEFTTTSKSIGIRYSLYYISDPTNTALLPTHLNFTTLMKEIRLADSKYSTVLDFRIVRTEYLNQKINDVCDIVVEQFQILLNQQLDRLKERTNYG